MPQEEIKNEQQLSLGINLIAIFSLPSGTLVEDFDVFDFEWTDISIFSFWSRAIFGEIKSLQPFFLETFCF